MKVNKLLLWLVFAAIGILVIMGGYQIFLSPPETVPSGEILPIEEYYGEDVFVVTDTSGGAVNSQ